MQPPAQTLADFLAEHRLPKSYADTAEQYFLPLAASLAGRQVALGRPMLVGINGSQGSGKSTLGALLEYILPRDHGLSAIALSIDDFYHTREHRKSLADTIHPLLMTRGVPGTHDVELMRATINALTNDTGAVQVPRFDKAQDDRAELAHWHQVGAPVDVILLEGWCVGIPAQSDEQLRSPVNQLEQNEDPDGHWRRWVNQQLRADYEPFYATLDLLIMLQAPGFECVHRWRLEQEHKLAARIGADNNRIMSEAQIARFIQHYQRLTEHGLMQLPDRADGLFRLDHDRAIVDYRLPDTGAR